MRTPFFFPAVRNRNEYAFGVEHAPGEIDAAGAILAVAMRALLFQEERMTGRDNFRVAQIRHLVSVELLDRHAKHKDYARKNRDIPHRLLSEKVGRRVHAAP
jgi:hypothetical protein